MILDYINLTFKNLRRRGIRSWLTMIGIFIGIAAVVSLISLGNGLQSAITGQFDTLDPNKLTVSNAETGFGPPGSTAVEKLNDHDLEVVRKVNGIDLTFGRLIRVVEVEYNDVGNFNYIADLPPNPEQIDVIYDAFNVDIESGRLLDKNDRGKVVLGNSFTENRFGREIRVGKKLEIQNKSFEVVGILERGSSFTINSVIIMPRDDLKDILNIGDEWDLIIVQVKDINEISKVRADIEKALREDRHLKEGEEDFSVQSPEESLSTINTVLSTINLVIGAIAAISLVVGGVGIANTMYTSVIERTKEIGVMKSVGAKNSNILSLFIIESSMLGLVGGVVGAIIGLALAFIVAYGVNFAFPGLGFSVDISMPLISIAILFSLLIGTVSGIFPALQASRLKPVEALRK